MEMDTTSTISKRKPRRALSSASAPAAPQPEVQEAPTFEEARVGLHDALSRWVFARVVKPCTVPADSREVDPVTGVEAITYFHGTAVRLDTGNGGGGGTAAGAGERVWFKKAPATAPSLLLRKRRRFRDGDVDGGGDLVIGPIRLKPADAAYIPQVGDVLMGKLQSPAAASSSSHAGGGCSSKFLFWYPDAYRVFVLARLVRLGTALSESDLASELRVGVSSGVRGVGGAGAAARWATFRRCGGGAAGSTAAPGGDDVWAVARLVLFGNVAAFANDTEGEKMNLSVSPLQFVYTCTLHFGDTSIWEHFKKLVPDAELPPFEGDDDDAESAPPPSLTAASAPRPRRVKPLPTPHPFGPRHDDDDAGGGGGALSCAPPLPPPPQHRGGAEPVSPPFYPTTPPPAPESPPYNPNSTPPASPPYNPNSTPPASPSYAPASPAYNPASSLDASADEYDPDRPTYDSTPLAAAAAPAPVMSVDSILAILKRVADLEETQK